MVKTLPVILNRRARHDYHILQTVEAGIALTGTEVKSLRAGRAQLAGAFARVERGEAWLHNAHIAEYEFGNRLNHNPKRIRKLLLHRHEIERLTGQMTGKGCALIPLRMYFQKGRVKIELALARGKTVADKREALRRKTDEREARAAVRIGKR